MSDRNGPGIFRRVVGKILYYYPLSLFGTLILASGIYLLVVFLNTKNPVSLVISGGFLLLTGLSMLAGRINAALFKKAILEWDSSLPLVAGTEETHQVIHMEGAPVFPFYNLHFRLSGVLVAGRSATIRVFEEHPLIERKGSRVPVPLFFPLAGTLRVKGKYVIRDIFGLSRTRIREDESRELPVFPPSVHGKQIKDIVTNQGFEESVKKRSQDEERYFMREYIPGDRIRDINWKASSRLAKLITKIAPMTQEQTKSVVVVFRNVKRTKAESLESIVHLNRLKSLLLSFLRQMKQSGTEYVFQITSATDASLLETGEDIERFAKELVGVQYMPEASALGPDPNTGELFVFTTQYDTGLAEFLSLFERARVTVVQTVSAGKRERAGKTDYRFFSPFRASLVPGRFIFVKEPRPRFVPPVNRTNLVYERDPIDIRL